MSPAGADSNAAEGGALKNAAQRVAARLWEDSARWRLARALLAPAAVLYGSGMLARNAAFRLGLLRTCAVAARTVSIGNLRVGGTGKTPLVRWLAETLRERGVPATIVSRGYGGAMQTAHVVGDGATALSDVAASGDEAVMLARTAGVPVVAGRDRVAAARLATERFGPRLLLCDDAFQHRRLGRDVDVVLVDADETGGVTRLLPSGPLREPLAALGRADVVVVCDRDGAAPGLPAIAGPLVVHASFAAVALVRPGANGWEEASLGTLAGQRVLVVSGVARPAPLYGALREWQAELAQVLEYPDHHVYGPRAWQEIAHAAKDVDLVVTTEKDLVKLERFPFARGKLVALRLGVTIDRPEALIGRVLGLAPGRQS